MIPVSHSNKPKSPSQPQEAIPSFIRKTYDILEEAKFPQLIDWTPDGTALVIKKPAEFAQKVLPAYFKHSNLTSFVRQLNMYNFHKRRTLDIGHVYFHELFQRGKRHLLKEIKRKNTDQSGEKGPKTPEPANVPSQNGTSLSSLAYENECIKQLYNEALSKISLFEGQLQQLTLQNQSLWTQVRQKNQKPATIPQEKKMELTQDQLPMTLGGAPVSMISFPAMTQVTQQVTHNPKENTNSLTKVTLSMGNINSFRNLNNRDSGVSTQASHDSPAIQTGLEADEELHGSASSTNMVQIIPNQIIQSSFNPFANSNTYLNNPFSNAVNGLSLARKEMSVGQIFEAWNSEGQNTEMVYFVDQKREIPESKDKYALNVYQDSSVLGKRQNDFEAQPFRVIEPAMKRHELSVFSRRRMTSTATEENEGTVDMDLMDFRF